MVDADSRAVDEKQVYERMHGILSRLSREAEIFLKIDSTLRGNIAALLRATREVFGDAVFFIVPAYPKMGRITEGGRQYVNGVSVEQAPMGRDPVSPVKDGQLASFLSEASVAIAPCEADVLKRAVYNAWESGVRAMIFDARTEAHMRRIAQLSGCFARIVWVGCAGIAQYLPVMARKGAIPLPVAERPMLIAAGSMSTVTRAQLHAFSGAEVLEWSVREILHERFVPPELHTARDVILCIRPGGAVADPRALMRGFIKRAVSVAQGMSPGCIVATGGDTARAIFDALHVKTLAVAAAVEEGVPALVEESTGRVFVTKAGAFGSRQVFSRVRNLLYGKGI